MKRTKHILVLTGWSYKDALVQVYTLPYLRILKNQVPDHTQLLLVTMEQEALRMTTDETKKTQSDLRQQGIHWIPFTYYKFGFLGMLGWAFHFFHLLLLFVRYRIAAIHAWCMPAGALGYLLSLVTRKPLVVDSYEPHAEAMIENETWMKNSFAFKLLFTLEKKLSRHARAVIATTLGMKKYALEKYQVEPAHFYVKPACVDLDYYSRFPAKNPVLLKQLNLEDKIVAVYAGKFGGIYLTGEVFDFIKVARDYWGPKLKFLLLTNHPVDELKVWASRSGLDWNDLVLTFVKPAEMPSYIGLADFALTPVKPVPTKRFCTPIKDGEYWAMGLPVVITKDISDDSEIIEQHDAGFVLSSLDAGTYLAAVKKIDTMLKLNGEETRQRIRSLAARYRNFSGAESVYREIYSTLIPL